MATDEEFGKSRLYLDMNYHLLEMESSMNTCSLRSLYFILLLFERREKIIRIVNILTSNRERLCNFYECTRAKVNVRGIYTSRPAREPNEYFNAQKEIYSKGLNTYKSRGVFLFFIFLYFFIFIFRKGLFL